MMEGEKEEESMTSNEQHMTQGPCTALSDFLCSTPPSHCFSDSSVPLFIELYYEAVDVKNVV